MPRGLPAAKNRANGAARVPVDHGRPLGARACPPGTRGSTLSLGAAAGQRNTHSLPQSNATAASQPSRYRPDAHAVIGHRYAHCHHHGVFGAAGHPRGRTNGCLSALPISPTCPLRQPFLQLRHAVCPPRVRNEALRFTRSGSGIDSLTFCGPSTCIIGHLSV